MSPYTDHLDHTVLREEQHFPEYRAETARLVSYSERLQKPGCHPKPWLTAVPGDLAM